MTIRTHGYDKYTRTLEAVILPDGMNLNQELVKQGWWWWYWTYAPVFNSRCLHHYTPVHTGVFFVDGKAYLVVDYAVSDSPSTA